MKCPYCGWETDDQHCTHCKAWIPEWKPEKKEESDDEPRRVRRNDKE